MGKARYPGVRFQALGSGRNREREARACQTRAIKVAEIHQKLLFERLTTSSQLKQTVKTLPVHSVELIYRKQTGKIKFKKKKKRDPLKQNLLLK